MIEAFLVGAGPYVALALQGSLMAVDEGLFHRWRVLSRTESWSHLVDTCLFAALLTLASFAPATDGWLAVYVAGSLLSSVLITKDEWIHAEECSPGEHWMHALLFVVHPLVLISIGALWFRQQDLQLRISTLVGVSLFACYQWTFWLGFGRARSADQQALPNNEFYDHLGPLWFDGNHHSQALQRREDVVRLRYIRDVLAGEGVKAGARVLDIGCGAGLISAPLALDGLEVKGIDASRGALAAAHSRAPEVRSLSYAFGNAYKLDEPPASCDVVLLLSVIGRVEDPERVLREAARALKPGGILFFGACNRSLRAWLTFTQGIKLLVSDIPPNLHVYRLFVKPDELAGMGARHGLALREIRGLRPRLLHKSLPLSILHHRLHPQFSFVFSRSLATGYVGYFVKAGTVEQDGCVQTRAAS